MNIFAYRITPYDGYEYDRDACAYVKKGAVGTKSVNGPCFSCGFGRSFSSGHIPYDQVETILSRSEYEYASEYGVSETIMDRLLSDEAMSFADEIRKSEIEIIMRVHEKAILSDVLYIFENAAFDYFDQGVIACIDSLVNIAEQKAWSLGYSDQPYFDWDAFEEDLVNQDPSIVELPSGLYAELYIW